ncbi:Hypothetical protein NocV09_04400170 [Nannochloropsis oceanica]
MCGEAPSFLSSLGDSSSSASSSSSSSSSSTASSSSFSSSSLSSPSSPSARRTMAGGREGKKEGWRDSEKQQALRMMLVGRGVVGGGGNGGSSSHSRSDSSSSNSSNSSNSSSSSGSTITTTSSISSSGSSSNSPLPFVGQEGAPHKGGREGGTSSLLLSPVRTGRVTSLSLSGPEFYGASEVMMEAMNESEGEVEDEGKDGEGREGGKA